VSEEKFQPIPEVEKAILEFREQQKEKSYSERHSELGRMLNCPFCDRRHRNSIACFQIFAKESIGIGRNDLCPCGSKKKFKKCCVSIDNGVELVATGRGHGKGRLTPHWNRRSLELVDLTRQLIPTYAEILNKEGKLEPDVKKARSRALNMLRKKWHEQGSEIQRQQKLSRKINRG
jgi:hypothetical protein